MIFSNDHLLRELVIRDSDEAQEIVDDDSDASASLD